MFGSRRNQPITASSGCAVVINTLFEGFSGFGNQGLKYTPQSLRGFEADKAGELRRSLSGKEQSPSLGPRADADLEVDMLGWTGQGERERLNKAHRFSL